MRSSPRLATLALPVLVGACGTGFEVARLTEPAVARAGAVRIEARQLHVSDDLAGEGVGHESEIVTELAISNEGPTAFELKPGALSLRMALDRRAPEKTFTLSPAWAGEGAFADQQGDGGYHLLFQPVLVPPGTTRLAWIVFRAYAFEGSDVPRRVSLAVGGTPERNTELTLADPALGGLRWEVKPVASVWMLGLQNHAFFGGHLEGSATALAITRRATAGRFHWDFGFASRLLVQVDGRLESQTSAFSGLGVNAHLAYPVWFGGSPASPRQLAVVGGGELGVLIAVQRELRTGETPPSYGVIAGELGLELGFGALRRAPTPFPFSPRGRPLPRFVTRAAYTHWRIGDGGTNGYTVGFRLAW